MEDNPVRAKLLNGEVCVGTMAFEFFTPGLSRVLAPPPKVVPSAQRNSDRRFRGRSGPDAGAGVASGLTTWGGTKEPNP